MPWDSLPEAWKATMTREEWTEIQKETDIEMAEEEAELKRPADWVEPSITLEEAEADPFCSSLANQMRQRGLTVMTRSQYFAMEFGSRPPRNWSPEEESNLPRKLQDPYLWVPGGPRRSKRKKPSP